MARIENSLSTTPRKKKMSTSNTSVNSALTPTNINLTNKINADDNAVQLINDNKSNSLSAFSKSPQNEDNTSIYRTSKDIAREMDALKNALKDKEHVINR